MMKRFMAVATIAGVFALSAPQAEAKLQKLDIGGKLAFSGQSDENAADFLDNSADSNAAILMDMELYFKAKFSDNVSMAIKLENPGSAPIDGTEHALEIKEAYIKVKEFLSPSLSMKVGVQKMMYDLRSNETAFALRKYPVAVKATYSNENIAVDVFTAVENENDSPGGNNVSGDRGYTGTALLYKLEGKSKVLASVINFQDKRGASRESYIQAILGARYFVPSMPLEVYGEFGVQNGDKSLTTDQDATAFYLGARYDFKDANMKPFIDGQFRSLSGDDAATTDQEGWNKLGKQNADTKNQLPYQTALLLETGEYYGAGLANNFSTQGQESFRLAVGIAPADKVTMALSVFIFNTDEKVTIGTGTSDDIGTEFDLTARWQYSEDLTLRAGFGLMQTGDAFKSVTAGGVSPDDVSLFFWDAYLKF